MKLCFVRNGDMAIKKRKKGPWSDKEIELLKKLFGSDSLLQISDTLNRSHSSVYSKARELGISKRKPVVWLAKEIKFLKRSYPTTSTWIVANKLNRSTSIIRRKAVELGLKKQ